MIIKKLHIENYRSLRKIDVECDPLTALLGLNNTGKSSLLHALAFFFDPGARVSAPDFYGYEEDVEIAVRVTFAALTYEEKQDFGGFLQDGDLTVTKRVDSLRSGSTARYFGTSLQIPRFGDVRNISQKSNRLGAYRALAASGELPGLPSTAASADAAEEQMTEYESLHPELLEPVERERQFIGPKNIGGGMLDKYTAFVFVPAVRDASGETERKGSINELIEMLVLRRVNARSDVQKLKEEFEARVKEVYSQDNLTELSELGTSLTQTLAQYAPGSALDLSWGEARVPEVQLPVALARLVHDNFSVPISHSGHGVQRALVLTLLQELAVAQRMTTRRGTEVEESETTPEAPRPVGERGPDLILAIEEPELYLHPLRCRYLAKLLLDLTASVKPIEPRNQIIYATHSAHFVGLERFDQIRLARRFVDSSLPAPYCEFGAYSLSKAAAELAKLSGKPANTFTRDSFRAHAAPVMSTEVSEGFFASVVVVVEGPSDAAMLQRVQAWKAKNWDALGVAVVEAIGKQNLDRPAVIFRGLGLPTYIVFDGDVGHQGTGEETNTVAKNVRYQKWAGVVAEDFPRTQVNANWAVFENELESEVKAELGDEMVAELCDQLCGKLGYRRSTVLKNSEAAARFVDLIYERGHQLRCLERIVDAVTAMV